MDAKMEERRMQNEAKYRAGIMDDEEAADCKWKPMNEWKSAQTEVRSCALFNRGFEPLLSSRCAAN